LSQSPSKPGHYSNSDWRNPGHSEWSQSPSKPGHYSNQLMKIQLLVLLSQSPSKPGHYSNDLSITYASSNVGRNPLQNRVTIQIEYQFKWWKVSQSQSPSKPGHYSNWKIKISRPRRILSQSPSKPGHYSNWDLQEGLTLSGVAIPFKTGSLFKFFFTKAGSFQQVAIPFKTGSLFKFRIVRKAGGRISRNPLQNRVTIQIICFFTKAGSFRRNPLQNRVTIQIHWDPSATKIFLSQSPSKPGHYSNVDPSGNGEYLIKVAIPFKTGSLFKCNDSEIEVFAVAIPFKTGSLFKLRRLESGGRCWLVAIPFKTGSLFKFLKLILNLRKCRNPLQNRVTIQIKKKDKKMIKWKSQSPSKPGHYSNC